MRHSVRITAFFFCISLFGSALFAQSPEREPLHFQTYTIEDGLSDNFVRDITQDQQGYIWVATGSGVSRFDGYGFEIFRNDPADSTTLSDNDVWAIHTDRENNVWVATQAWIDRLDRSSQSFRRYQVVTGAYTLTARTFAKFYESEAGTLYIGTARGLAVYDNKKQEFRVITADEEEGSALSHPEVTSIAESADGRLWIGTYGGGINILNPETGAITWLRHDPDDVHTIPNDYIFNLFIDQDQVLWVNYNRLENQFTTTFSTEIITPGSPSGLWKKDLKTGSAEHYLYNPERGHPTWDFISHFEQTRDGKIWMSQQGAAPVGLKQYNDGSNTFFGYSYDVTDPGSLPWNFATSLLEDHSGNFWVGTSRGLARADRSQIRMNAFTPDPADRYNINNFFFGIGEAGLNQFLISSIGRPIILWNRDTNTWKPMPDDIIPQELPLVYDGRSHAWLLSVENVIERVHLETWEKQQYVLNESTAGKVTINHFLRLSDEVILIATREGLWELSPSSGRFTKIDVPVPFTAGDETDIKYLAADSTGKVWLGINNASLDASHSKKGILIARYDPISGETVFPDINDTYLSALGNGALNHLMIGSRGQVWVSKSNGLVRFDPETNRATFYNAQDGLRHLTVFGTLEDKLGMIWISTLHGISRLNPDTGSIRNFGRNDGLRPARMNPHSFYKRENGELMFGGVGGLSYFNPENIRESEEPPLISLVRLEYGDVTVNLSGAIAGQSSVDIDWGANSVSLEFVSVNFRNPGETTYLYKLEGFHSDWVDAGNRRFAQFSNLPPKSYTFHVRAVNADGLTSTQTASVSFRVLPPWWRTWWAYGFYLMLLIAAIVAADRVQRRRVQQKERERAREKELEQAKEIEKAYENLKAAQDQLVQQEKLASLGQLTAGIAHEIKNPLNFVNNFSDVSLEMIDEALEELKQIGENEHATETAAILADIKSNLAKIHQHGSRADGIVKSMLQHSRGGDGKMEPTPLNPLIKEYVNLAYHGMRAGKEAINVDIDLQLDDSIGEVSLIAEDFSRVILNLTNNAFDAMRERVTSNDLQGFENLGGLEPKLTVRTKSDGNTITIEIEDNGPGIPDEIKDKIMQPFFTTKKGTQGTGLGLSITNDIVKAHGGSLNIESGAKGSIFKIYIPK